MPRFFFHIYDDAVSGDEEGLVLAGVVAAREAAVEGARAMICAQVMKGRLNLGHWIEVEDEMGEPVLILGFVDALKIEDCGPHPELN